MVVEEAGRERIKGGGQVLQIVKGRCQADCIQLVRVHPEVSNGEGVYPHSEQRQQGLDAD